MGPIYLTIVDQHAPGDRLRFSRSFAPDRAAAYIVTWTEELVDGPQVRLQADDCIRLAQALLSAAEVQNAYREATR
jgi:hypothetical protein